MAKKKIKKTVKQERKAKITTRPPRPRSLPQAGGRRGGRSPAKRAPKKEREETVIQEIVNHYFYTKGLSLEQIKDNAKKKKIIYSRFTRPAKQLLELAGSVKKAKQAINIIAEWAKSRGLDYTIETVFKRWLELGRLKPKEIIKKPYYQGNPMVWSETRKKWYVIDETGSWLEFAGKEEEIEWRIVK